MAWIAKAARCQVGAHVLGLQIISTYQGKRERRHITLSCFKSTLFCASAAEQAACCMLASFCAVPIGGEANAGFEMCGIEFRCNMASWNEASARFQTC